MPRDLLVTSREGEIRGARGESAGLERDGAVEFAATLWPDDPRQYRTHDNRARGVSLGSVGR